jgi:uncharacterized flavoprotein (TIGR03862 family)
LNPPSVAVVGGGPAGLMAAEVLAGAGVQVQLFDRMPSVGRKFLLAGKGGLNLTHAEDFDTFITRYGQRHDRLLPALQAFTPAQLRDWAAALGIPTFVGSSGRVFPADLKAAPLLRAWLHRLRRQRVAFHMRHRWLGWAPTASRGQALRFATPHGEREVTADALLLAVGGGSWPQLGSDGDALGILSAAGVDCAPLQPSNCGFEVRGRGPHGWSEHFRARQAGQPLKSVALQIDDGDAPAWRQTGEMVISDYGIEGSLVYAASPRLRERIEHTGQAPFRIDLLPQRNADWLFDELAHPRGSRSLSTHLKSRIGLHGAKAALLHELLPAETLRDARQLALSIKALPMVASAARPLREAISSAGGVRFEALDANSMLRGRPGVFCAGEMLDWEAPTGGYLLNACLASGRAAGHGVLDWLQRTTASRPAFPGTAIP